MFKVLSLIGTFLVIVPIPFALYGVWRDYLVRKNKSELALFIVIASVPISSFICMCLLFFDRRSDNTEYFLGYRKLLNRTVECYSCGITSRKYQYNTSSTYKCLHCGNSRMNTSNYSDDEDYPFAPKLSEFGTIKYILRKNKMDKLNEKLNRTERYDKELEAYEQLQLKKLQELETKASEIRAELVKTGVSQ